MPFLSIARECHSLTYQTMGGARPPKRRLRLCVVVGAVVYVVVVHYYCNYNYHLLLLLRYLEQLNRYILIENKGQC